MEYSNTNFYKVFIFCVYFHIFPSFEKITVKEKQLEFLFFYACLSLNVIFFKPYEDVFIFFCRKEDKYSRLNHLILTGFIVLLIKGLRSHYIHSIAEEVYLGVLLGSTFFMFLDHLTSNKV